MIEPLPPDMLQLGGNPTTLAQELRNRIQFMMDGNERSQQVEIGASEIGTPCARKLIYKLGDVPAPNGDHGTWRQQVGTFIHSGLAEMLTRWNQELRNLGLPFDRFVIEEEVIVGPFGNRALMGHVDVYDRLTGSVLDWKTLGANSLKKMKAADHPGQTYEIQGQCYALAIHRAGLPVSNVHILSLPQSGDLSQMYHWATPFDPSIGERILAKAESLVRVAESGMGYARLAAISGTAEDYCEYCPWFAPFQSDPAEGRCPGAEVIIRQRDKRRPAVTPPAFK